LGQVSVRAFQPTTFFGAHKTTTAAASSNSFRIAPLAADQQDDSDGDDENPYQDPNYPDLEFVNYADPEYSVDQGDEFFSSAHDKDDEAEIEEMREDRRRRNDEYQFETYFQSICKSGEVFYGEWSLYKTSTFLSDETPDRTIPQTAPPRVVRARHPIKVQSRGYKIKIDTESSFRVDGEAICHEEIIVKEERDNESKEVRVACVLILLERVVHDGSPPTSCRRLLYRMLCTCIKLFSNTAHFKYNCFSKLPLNKKL